MANISQINGSLINAATASLATTASFASTASYVGPTLNQNLTISGTLNVNSLNAVTSSVQYITSSQLDISTNIIKLNTTAPLRYGGIAVVDSGSSPQLSGSFLFDSQNNQWISIHQSAPAAATTSSVIIMGPQTFNNIGNEQTITTNRLTKGSGGDLGEHITSSNITDTGTLVSVNSNTQITGSLIVSAGITGSLSGNATTATTAATASKVITGLVTTNAIHYIPFVATNHGGSGTNFLGTVAAYNFNPSTSRLEITGSLSATAITGSLRGTASYATMASQSGYTMQFVLATTGSNLAASTTYRMGAPVRNQLNTTSGRTRIYVPRPGKVRYAHLYIRTNGTLASAGTSTLALNKNSSVGETIATSTTAGSSADATVSSTAISMSVVQGDFLEINWITPAWVTLPTAVEASAIIYIENNI
jgi:CheY-specific phosphatase CheX